MNIKERDKKIDVLRALAFFGIVIAHANSPKILMQLRNFDVPLMAMLMGTSFYLSNNNKKTNYFSYVSKRLKRLLIPTWEFLTIFFVLFFIISLIRSEKYYFGVIQIIRSYALIDGIGYVWIVQVFLVITLLNPLMLKISKGIKNNIKYFLFLLSVYIVYMILIRISAAFNGETKLFFEHFVLYTIGYGLVAAIGIRIKQMHKKEITVLAAVFLGVFILLAVVNHFRLTSIAKYPPTMYYLSYALFTILTLYLILDIRHVFKLVDNKFIYFCSENSFWLYLWHIIPITLILLFGNSIPIISANFITRFLFAITAACLLTNIQNKLSYKIHFNRSQTIDA